MMQTVFRIAYSLAVAILFVLFVILGTRTFYEEPEAPPYPEPPFRLVKPPVYCEPGGGCFNPETGERLTKEQEERLSEEEREYIRAQREFEEKRRAYEDDRGDYHRNVFIVASVLGVAAVAVGLYLFRRVEAMPLGLLLGGIGVIIFGWVQAAEDFGEIGMAPLFAVVAVGLAIVLAAGYWLLALPRPAGNGGQRQEGK